MWEVIDFESKRREHMDPNDSSKFLELTTIWQSKKLSELRSRIWLTCDDYIWALLRSLDKWENILWDYQRESFVIPYHYQSHIRDLSIDSARNILNTINNELLPSLKKSRRENRQNLIEDCILLRKVLLEKLALEEPN